MMSVREKTHLQMLLNYLEHQEIANQYQNQLFSPVRKRYSKIDVSNRLRDQKGRFLPHNYQMEESNSTYDEEIELQRKFKVNPIPGSYNSYSIDDKEKRDWSGNIYLLCFLGILIIAFIS